MARQIINLTNTDAPDSDYPYGRVRNNTGTNNGTPVNEAMLGDSAQFFQKLLDEGNITPNNLPDNNYSGFQLFEALQSYMKTYPYKSYNAVLTQSGTSAPVAIVMPGNEIGNIVWTRNSIGNYTGTLAGAFTDSNKFMVLISGNTNGVIACNRGTADTVVIGTRDLTDAGADDVLQDTGIEIRMFQ